MIEKKKISASRLVKFIFPDAYKDVPEWILSQAAEFGKELHETIQGYIEYKELDESEITEGLSPKQQKLFQAFQGWFLEENLPEPKAEYYVETDDLHGIIDLIDLTQFKFYDYKFRNVDDKLNITKDVLQMRFYQMILAQNYNRVFSWELIFFDKKTTKVFKFKSSQLTLKQELELQTIITNAVRLIQQTETLTDYTYDNLEGKKRLVFKWEPEPF